MKLSTKYLDTINCHGRSTLLLRAVSGLWLGHDRSGIWFLQSVDVWAARALIGVEPNGSEASGSARRTSCAIAERHRGALAAKRNNALIGHGRGVYG